MESLVLWLGAAFVLALAIGMTVRAVRAPRGQRLRAAFGRIMGAGETYQELHTGQKGLRVNHLLAACADTAPVDRPGESPVLHLPVVGVRHRCLGGLRRHGPAGDDRPGSGRIAGCPGFPRTRSADRTR